MIVRDGSRQNIWRYAPTQKRCAEGGRVGVSQGCSFGSRLLGLGDCRDLHFWRILKATERSFLHLYADALSLSNSVSCHISGARPRFGGLNCPLPQRRRAPVHSDCLVQFNAACTLHCIVIISIE